MKVSEVFISGGLPTITYNPRVRLNLEQQLTDYIDTGYKLLSITGPTKSGKTVLCKKLMSAEECVFLSGGNIRNESDFWISILHELNVVCDSSVTTTTSSNKEEGHETDGGINIGVVKLGASLGSKETKSSGVSETQSNYKNDKLLACKTLIRRKMSLVIDDFHYIESSLQATIIRALKQPVFDGLRVIILAVPHRALDSVKVESEMTGRVVQLSIPLWDEMELQEIAIKGFNKLGIQCEIAISGRLAKESYGSPHLMQEFCLRLCKLNSIVDIESNSHRLLIEPDYSAFFSDVVTTICSKVAFERLAKGPRQRADRVQRKLINGDTVDIYSAVLLGIAETGPKPGITYEELRTSLKNVLKENPQGHEITRVLSKMDEIAKSKLSGEPVIDWDRDNNILYITDPFFAFYLKWGIKYTDAEN